MKSYLLALLLDCARLSIWLVLLMLLFIPLERLFSLKKQRIFRPEFSTDLAYFFLNSLLPKLMLVLPMSMVAAVIHRLEPMGLYSWVATFPFLLRFPLAIIVGEFGTYWGHRWSHEIPILWRFHSIHHSAKEIDWLVNTRAHPFDMFFTRFTGLLPVYLLGLAQPTSDTVDLVPVLYAIVGTVWSFFVHANVRWRFGWLEHWIATPPFTIGITPTTIPNISIKTMPPFCRGLINVLVPFIYPKNAGPENTASTRIFPRI